ncbi:putative ankyrin repeat protein RF_0381 [Leptopilina boulardi]|uniref:putative ankyrin repeat protein RF_0381 n=1 Tax=Leptopilina boulardi TaxID=63433 RepID=UPI0021F66E6D|nr:putative ankyrin repeat protein RF_0381 [Leptopilina boulardi]
MSDTKRKRTPSFKRAKLVERPARKISQPEILTLISAIKKNNINEVNEFLKSENQNNDFKQNGLNMTPLHYAVQGKNVKIVKLMIDHGYGKINDKNQLYKTPLDLALENNSLEIFKCLIENESENCSDLFFLHKVVKKGNLEILKYLLANGAEVNIFTKEKNESPLSCAICKGNTEMVIELLKYGAKNKKCYINAKLVKDDILILLLKAGHSMENYFGTQIPLIVAVEMGSWKLIKFLIESNIDVNSQTNLYNIVFSIALTNGNSKIVRILLAAGADPIGKIKIKNSIEFLIHQKLWTNLQKIQILQHILNYCPIKYLDLTILSYIELAIKEKTSAHLIDMLINYVNEVNNINA